MYIWVWPDDSWCFDYQLDAHMRDATKSDDAVRVSIPEFADEYDCDNLAVAVNRHPDMSTTTISCQFFGL